MAYDGTLKFDTSLDASGFQKGANTMTQIAQGLGIFKILEAGFRAIAASVDDAVSRYDTLNQFPKVLQQMGYSANDSQAAMQKLSNGIQGLPTTLDSIVGSTKQLVVATGDLDTGVDTALALNNAFLASGASAADAERGTTQYIQMLSKGKPDMQSWRTLQETMTYALTETAHAFGFTGQAATQELYTALQNGSITFSDFNAKLIELNSGVGGFAEVAKTATAGIGTAWTNMQTHVVMGVAKVISAIDEGFSKNRFQSIENIITSMTKGVDAAFEGVATAAEFVAKNFDVLTVAVVAVGVAFAAWKLGEAISQFQVISESLRAFSILAKATTLEQAALNGTMTASQIIVGVLTGQISLLTLVQTAWNAAMAANPIGVILVTITAAIAAIALLATVTNRGTEEQQRFRAEAEALVESSQALHDSIQETADAFEDEIGTIEQNAVAAQSLIDKITELSDKENKSAAEKRQLATEVAKLNAMYPELNVRLNATKDAVEGGTDALQANTDALTANAKAAAQQDYLEKMAQDYVQLEVQIAATEEKMRLMEEAGLHQKAVVTSFGQQALVASDEYAILEAQLEADTLAVEELDGQMTETANSMTNMGSEAGNVAAALVASFRAMTESTEEWREAAIDGMDDVINSFKEIPESAELSLDELNAILEKNNERYLSWKQNLVAASELLGPEMMEVVQSWGPEYNSLLEEYLADPYGEKGQMFYDQLSLASETGAMGVADSAPAYEAAGQTTGEAVNTGMAAGMAGVVDTVSSAATEVISAMGLMSTGVQGEVQGMADQSAVIAQQMAQTIGSDVATLATDVVNSIVTMGGGVTASMDDTASQSTATNQSMVDTISSDVASGAQAIADSFTEMGSNVTATLNDTSSQATSTNQQMVSQLGSDVASGAQAIVDSFTSMGTNVTSSLSNTSSQATTTNQQMVSALSSDVASGAQAIADSFTSMSGSVTSTMDNTSNQAVSTNQGMMDNMNADTSSQTDAMIVTFGAFGSAVALALATLSTTSISTNDAMMAAMNATVASQSVLIAGLIATMATGIILSLSTLEVGAVGAINAMMDGMLAAMDAKAAVLYAKAEEIASNIANAMRDALQVQSPSKVMIGIFEDVMMGVYEGMENREDLVYDEAEKISNKIAEHLNIEPTVAASLAGDALEAMVDAWDDSVESLTAARQQDNAALEDWAAEQAEIFDSAKGVVEDYVDQTSDGFNRLTQESTISLDEYIENLQANAEAMALWSENVNVLMGLGVDGIVEQLSEMGPAGAEQAARFVEELQELNNGAALELGKLTSEAQAKLDAYQAAMDLGLSEAIDASVITLQTGALDEAGAAMIDGAAATVTEAITGADFNAYGQTISNNIQDGMQEADQEDVMAGTVEAVATGTDEVVSATNEMTATVQDDMQSMSDQSTTTVQSMSQEISAIISGMATNIVDSMNSMATGIILALSALESGGVDVINAMMDGMLVAMEEKAEVLYAKAREIAENIAETMRSALDVHSPSRVMFDIFTDVMLGVYEGMESEEDRLYRKADEISEGLAERLAVEPDVASSFVGRLQAMVDASSMRSMATSPVAAMASAGGGTVYNTTLVQHNTSPDPLSPSELTREAQDLLRRSKFLLP